MEEIQLYVGLKLTDGNNVDWRIFSLSKTMSNLIKMNTSSREFKIVTSASLIEKILNGQMTVSENQDTFVLDTSKFSESEMNDYEKKKDFLHEISDIFGPSYLAFISKERKPEMQDLLKKYNFSKTLANRIILRWLQSGLQDGSWMDPRYRNSSKHRNISYTTKTGRPAKGTKSEVIVCSEIREQFDYGIEVYKSAKKMTKTDAYAYMLYRYYTYFDEENNTMELVDVKYRPTLRQFLYYMSSKLTKLDEQLIKTSRDEFYNDHRALFGFNRSSAVKPGHIVEVDALEMDINIVSEFNKQQNISRPIVYMMTDLYSHAIVAFHVGFDNNSMLGLSSLMMNLFDDKEMLLKEHGITEVDTRFWPSRFIPHEIRCDRGSDFASDQFEKICNELNIIRTVEHGATGSMKGLIEQSFRQFHQTVLPGLEHQGVILKRYDSKHKKEACLTIEQIFNLLVMFVIKHNQHYVKSFSLTKDMLKHGVDKTPTAIWEYGEKTEGKPIPITPTNYPHCIYKVLPEGTATLCREGVKFNGLLFRCNPNDRELLHDIMMSQVNAGKKDKNGSILNAYRIHYDPRSIDEIYYFKDGQIETLTLDPNKNNGLEHITWEEYEEYRLVKTQLDKNGVERNLRNRVKSIDFIRNLASDAVAPTYASAKNTNKFRKLEKNEANYNNRVSSRIHSQENKEKLSAPEEALSINEPIVKDEVKTGKIDSDETERNGSKKNNDCITECPPELCDFLDL